MSRPHYLADDSRCECRRDKESGTLIVCAFCEDATVETPTPGTRWTEPGMGATVREILTALYTESPFVPNEAAVPVRRSFAGTDARLRTNLALTGTPLTADDLKNIERAEVSR